MQIALPELTSPATLILDRERGLSEEKYLAFCEANPDLRLERTAQGEIVIVPPAGGESDYRCLDAGRQLGKARPMSKAFPGDRSLTAYRNSSVGFWRGAPAPGKPF